MKSFKTYLTEAIVVTIRNHKLFIKNVIKNIEQISDETLKLLEKMERLNRAELGAGYPMNEMFPSKLSQDVGNMLGYLLIDKGQQFKKDYDIYYREYDRLPEVYSAFKDAQKMYEHMENSEREKQYQWERLLVMDYDRASKILDREENKSDPFRRDPKYKKEFYEMLDRYANDPDEYYEQSVKDFCKELHSIATKADRLLDYIQAKLNAFLHYNANKFDELELMPYQSDDSKVAELYHTSFQARQIFEKGFQKNYERNGMMGLGGSTSIDYPNRDGNEARKKFEEGGISFTYDKGTANTILRCFKEVWMICHQKLTHRDIFAWAKREHIDVAEMFKQASGSFDISKTGIKDMLGWKNDGIDLRKDWTKVPQEVFTPTNTLYLYRWYLSLSKRTDPMFFGNLNDLYKFVSSKVKLEDIGVIVADVDISDVKGKNAKGYRYSNHKSGEAEFRITPDHVLKIKSWYRS